MIAYRSAAVWIEIALGCFAAAAERMPEAAFLATLSSTQHAADAGRRSCGKRARARMVAQVSLRATNERRVTCCCRDGSAASA